MEGVGELIVLFVGYGWAEPKATSPQRRQAAHDKPNQLSFSFFIH